MIKKADHHASSWRKRQKKNRKLKTTLRADYKRLIIASLKKIPASSDIAQGRQVYVPGIRGNTSKNASQIAASSSRCSPQFLYGTMA